MRLGEVCGERARVRDREAGEVLVAEFVRRTRDELSCHRTPCGKMMAVIRRGFLCENINVLGCIIGSLSFPAGQGGRWSDVGVRRDLNINVSPSAREELERTLDAPWILSASRLDRTCPNWTMNDKAPHLASRARDGFRENELVFWNWRHEGHFSCSPFPS